MQRGSQPAICAGFGDDACSEGFLIIIRHMMGFPADDHGLSNSPH